MSTKSNKLGLRRETVSTMRVNSALRTGLGGTASCPPSCYGCTTGQSNHGCPTGGGINPFISRYVC